MATDDRTILRDLAKQYLEVCEAPVQKERRRLWRQQNSLKHTRPLIYIRAFAWTEMPHSACCCEDPFYRPLEDFFRNRLFWNTFEDDSVFEPWVTIQATHCGEGWGIPLKKNQPNEPGGAYKVDYPIKDLEDLEKLQAPRHEIDEEKTAANLTRVQDAIGDIMAVDLDRGPWHLLRRFGLLRLDPGTGAWTGDISSDLGFLRGIEHFMADMLDNPEWLHRFARFLSDGILRLHDQAEAAGDFSLGVNDNQAMPYAEELEDLAPNVTGLKRSQLWARMAAQEFTGVSPAMHDEFLLQYQLPILEPFGLVAYGCCEDLTHKIDMLRQIPNLRRISVPSFSDVGKCAEQIGRDYVLSYRPSPADMVSYGLDPDHVRSILRSDLEVCRGCHVDITLKDVETVQGDPDRIRRWVALTREVIDEVYG